jgi:hypothetical protein
VSAVLPTRTAVPSHLIAPPRARCHDHSSAPPGHRSCCNHSPAAGPAQSRHCPPDECFTAAISDISLDRSSAPPKRTSVRGLFVSLLRARSHDLSSAPAKRTPVQSHFVSLLRARSCDHSSVPSGRTPVHRHLRYNFLSPLRASHESHATSSTATAHCLCHHRSFSAPTASRSLPAALNPLAAMSTYLRHRPLLRAPARFPALLDAELLARSI